MVARYTLTQREKILIRIFVLLILVGGLYQLCYNYTWLNIKKIKIAIENEKKSLEAIRNTVSKKEKIKKEYAKIETRLKSMMNREQVDIRTGSSWLQIQYNLCLFISFINFNCYSRIKGAPSYH